jgi:regulator of protease activity HflC (stomatin/prohibitin superfamily)
MDLAQLFMGIAVGLGLFGLYALALSFFRVDEGQLGVVTSFGAALRDGKRLRTFGPGLHTKAPWARVHKVSIKEQNIDLSGEESGQTAMAHDGTLLRFDSILRYVPLEEELERYLFGLRHRRKHVTGLFTCLLRNEIANFRGGEPASETSPERPESALALTSGSDSGSYALIRRERGLLNRRIDEFVREKIGDRYGVRFSAVDLTDILPPDELADALNAVLSARSEADGQFARAESDCQQRVLSAERGVEIAKARATAAAVEAERLGVFLAELADRGVLAAYVKRRRAEVLSDASRVFVKSTGSREVG